MDDRQSTTFADTVVAHRDTENAPISLKHSLTKRLATYFPNTIPYFGWLTRQHALPRELSILEIVVQDKLCPARS